MFKKFFAKYARAVSDGRERKRLYNLYCARIISEIIFFALCAAIIIESLIFSEAMETAEITDLPFIVFGVTLLLWIISAIVTLALWLSFRSAYKRILNSPARADEMPQVASYRQKVKDDKKSTFRKLWWAWLVFGLCAAAFIACIAMEVIKNPESEEFGAWGIAAFWVLLAGVLVIVFAYMYLNIKRQQSSNTIEQQTENEAKAIDEAQGRRHKYNLQSDPNLQTFRYLFRDKELYAEAELIRKKRTKIITTGVIILTVAAIAAAIVFFASGTFGDGLSGYAMPAAFTLIFGGVFLLSLPLRRAYADIEKRQKAELETNPAYARNLEWYKLYENFSKFKGKVYIIFIAAGIVLGWVLAALFPSSVWSLFMLAPIIAGLLINNALVKDLRRKAIPIEREIDAAECARGGEEIQL